MMGMTDALKVVIRFALDGLEEALEEDDMEKKNRKIQKIIDNIQQGLK